ncbi:MAG: 1-acyl-sn-glycerol-3-phosphate acyltransferase, partial [Deltaproteobacteria bacterium]|nr:1-acyl-sn-glycerol-3-phosphate acyltransferase [Deltaproteobacteria bacterium]
MARGLNNPGYPFVMEEKPSLFLGWFLYRLFGRVQLEQSMVEPLRRMSHEGPVLYAIKYPGRLDFLLYHYLYRKRRLPYPRIALDHNLIWFLPLRRAWQSLAFYTKSLFRERRVPNPVEDGFLEQALKQGASMLLPLVDPKGFRRQFVYARKDPLQLLLETQMTLDRSIHIVPQLVIYDKAPERETVSFKGILFGYRDNPGFLRKSLLFFARNRRAFIDFGSPVDLKAFLAARSPERSLEDTAAELRQLLVQRIDEQKRVILGPVMKSRQQLKETVLRDPELSRLMETMAQGDRRKLKVVRRKAGGLFDDIAADYNPTYVELAVLALSWLWKRIFEGIDVDPSDLARVREGARKGPVIYVPSHKSHVDYLVLNYVLHQHHTHTPRIAAGENLAFWPVGHFFRKT